MKKFPQVGFGTWEITGEEVYPAIVAAINSGYRHIDTAQIYNNEFQIGEALGKLGSPDVYITSKIWTANYKTHTLESLQGSLKRLGVKKINQMLLHVPLGKNKYDDVIISYRELMKARDQGLIDSVGVSNFPVDLLEYIKSETGEYPFSNQIVLSPTVILEDIEIFCKQNDIELTGYSTLRSYFNPNPWYEGSGMNETQKARVDELASKYNKNVGQLLSQWAIQCGYHVIPKSINADRIKSNFALNDFELTTSEIDELRSWNTYTTEQMFSAFSTQIPLEDYDETMNVGLLFEKNFPS